MDIKFNPAMKAAGFDPSMVDKLVEAQKVPVEQAKARKAQFENEKKEVDKFVKLLSELDTALNSLKTRYDFYKLKLDSSNPDIIDGDVSPGAALGTYDFEVRSLAKADKQLAYGFPDKDETPVGFGYMTIKRDDGEEVEVQVDPGTTLNQLARQINDSEAGVRAMVINTHYKPDSFRLLVISEKSGKEATIEVDEDTTFLEFKHQVAGRNLDVLFEDVPVTNDENMLKDLIDGVTLNFRRSEPGTEVQVSIIHDLDATIEGIRNFVAKYNEVATFVNNQFVKNPETGQYGLLSGDATLKYVMRQLQSTIVSLPTSGAKSSNLATVGITTDPKTGRLNLDENKFKQALTNDYDSVAALFIHTPKSEGVAGMLSQKLKDFRNPSFGAVKSRQRGLERIIQTQDKNIERRQHQLEDKEKMIRRQFGNLEEHLSQMQGQSAFLKAKFAADQQK